jgi:hypothetical protein
MTDTGLASLRAKVGNRYFKVDEGYDKRVYENSYLNYLRITITLAFFYVFMSCHWWACFEYGIYDSESYTRYCIILFICCVVFIGGMLVSGKFANYNKRHHIFLEEVIAEKQAMKDEEEERLNQELLYKQKLAKKADGTRM